MRREASMSPGLTPLHLGPQSVSELHLTPSHPRTLASSKCECGHNEVLVSPPHLQAFCVPESSIDDHSCPTYSETV